MYTLDLNPSPLSLSTFPRLRNIFPSTGTFVELILTYINAVFFCVCLAYSERLFPRFFSSPFSLAHKQTKQWDYVQVADAIHKQIADLSSIVAGLKQGLQGSLAGVGSQPSLARGGQDVPPSSRHVELPGGASLSPSTGAVARLSCGW